MAISDPGMPPREEAAAVLSELAGPRTARPDAERRRVAERIPVISWLLVAALAGMALLAWVLSRP